MEEQKDSIEKMLIKLQVLESKIQKLETITDDILNEVNIKYRNQINNMILKKEAMQQLLSQIQEADSK